MLFSRSRVWFVVLFFSLSNSPVASYAGITDLFQTEGLVEMLTHPAITPALTEPNQEPNNGTEENENINSIEHSQPELSEPDLFEVDDLALEVEEQKAICIQDLDEELAEIKEGHTQQRAYFQLTSQLEDHSIHNALDTACLGCIQIDIQEDSDSKAFINRFYGIDADELLSILADSKLQSIRRLVISGPIKLSPKSGLTSNQIKREKKSKNIKKIQTTFSCRMKYSSTANQENPRKFDKKTKESQLLNQISQLIANLTHLEELSLIDWNHRDSVFHGQDYIFDLLNKLTKNHPSFRALKLTRMGMGPRTINQLDRILRHHPSLEKLIIDETYRYSSRNPRGNRLTSLLNEKDWPALGSILRGHPKLSHFIFIGSCSSIGIKRVFDLAKNFSQLRTLTIDFNLDDRCQNLSLQIRNTATKALLCSGPTSEVVSSLPILSKEKKWENIEVLGFYFCKADFRNSFSNALKLALPEFKQKYLHLKRVEIAYPQSSKAQYFKATANALKLEFQKAGFQFEVIQFKIEDRIFFRFQ